MSRHRDFSRELVLEAIKGSGGIMSTVAAKLNCAWDTAKRYVNQWESTKVAFSNERQSFIDACEAVLMANVRLAQQAQRSGEIVETNDVKWVLARLGKDRDYTERQQIDLRAIDLSQLNESQLMRLADGDDLLSVLTTPGTG